MALVLTLEQRTDLESAAARARQTRTWKRYRALLLLGRWAELRPRGADAGLRREHALRLGGALAGAGD